MAIGEKTKPEDGSLTIGDIVRPFYADEVETVLKELQELETSQTAPVSEHQELERSQTPPVSAPEPLKRNTPIQYRHIALGEGEQSRVTPHLEEAIKTWHPCNPVIIEAPTGSGKTTLLSTRWQPMHSQYPAQCTSLAIESP